MTITVNGSTEEIELNTDESVSYDDYSAEYKREYEVSVGTEISYTFYFLDMTMDGRYGDENGFASTTETIVVNDNMTKDFWKEKTSLTLNITIPSSSDSRRNDLPIICISGSGEYIDVELPQPSTTEIIHTITYNVPPYSKISLDAYSGGVLYNANLMITNSSIYPADNYLEINDMAYLISDYNNNVDIIDVKDEIDFNCCVPYYSQILYPNNLTKSAEEVKVGDIILGYNESNNTYQDIEILNIVKKSRNDICKIIFEDDTYVELTPDHPILTNIGWCAYKPETSTAYESMGLIHQLETNQQVLQLNGEYKQIKEIQMNYLEQPIDVYTFNTTERVDTFIADNCVVHNASECGIPGWGDLVDPDEPLWGDDAL
jgi:hypothetical protein